MWLENIENALEEHLQRQQSYLQQIILIADKYLVLPSVDAHVRYEVVL